MKNNKLTWRDWLIFAAIFLLAAGIRVYPEILGGTWPIGYDTLNSYLPELAKFDGNFGRWFFGSDLFYLISWPLLKIFHLDPILFIKAAGCALYGTIAGIFYLFARKFLGWGKLQSFIVGALLVIQLPSLRLSWDLFRNMLALIFLFPAIYCLFTNHKVKNLICLFILSILIILSNPLVTGLWFVLIIVWLIHKLATKEYYNFGMILLSVLPAVILFLLSMNSSSINNFNNRVYYQAEPERILSYFTAYVHTMPYKDLSLTITSLFWFYYQLLLVPALYGFWLLRKNILLSALTLWLLLGTFSSLIFGGYGLFVWDRWVIMLVFPFTLYAVAGFWDIGHRLIQINIFKAHSTQILLKTIAVISWLALTGLIVGRNFPFVSVPSQFAQPPYLNPKINAYLPPSMVNNAVGFENIKDVLSCLDYLDLKASKDSVIVVDNRYRGLLLLKFDFSRDYIYSYAWSAKINQKTLADLPINNSGPVYTIWANANIEGFKRVYRSGQMAVYRDIKTYEQYSQTSKD